MLTKNNLIKLAAQIVTYANQLPEEKQEPVVDSQGRIISVPEGWKNRYYYHNEGFDCVEDDLYDGGSYAVNTLNSGVTFISEEAAKAEITRRKCIQRLRGVNGFCELNVVGYNSALYIKNERGEDTTIIGYFKFKSQVPCQSTVTEEEKDAFNYKWSRNG